MRIYNKDGSKNTYLEGILKDGIMFFNKPSTFEDKHDCEVYVKMHGINSILHNFIRNELEVEQPGTIAKLQQN